MSEIPNQSRWTDYGLLIVLSAAVYGRLIGYDFQTSWDDNWVILYEDSVKGFSPGNIQKAFSSYVLGSYVPLSSLSYMLDYTLWGLDPRGFHLANVMYHTLNGCLFYRLLLRWYADRVLVFSASALFLLHPVQVEVVAWITQRRTLLCMLFVLLSWEFYCRYRDAGTKNGRNSSYAASLACFVLALLSKSEAVVLPLVFVMYDYCFRQDGPRVRLIDKMPFVAGAAMIAAVSLISQTAPDGARVSFHGGTPYSTLMTMLPVFSRYIGMLVWPSGLSAFYAPLIRQSLDLYVIGSFLLMAGILLLAVRAYGKDRRLSFWIIFCFVGLLPVSQIVPINTLMQDRYLYFPLLGVSVLAASLITGFGRNGASDRRRLSAYLAIFMVLLACAITSFNRAAVWKDSVSLWSDAAAKEPASDKAWELLGESLAVAGRKGEAVRAYERGYALNPGNPEILQGLGALYTDLGELDRGRDLLQKLLTMKPGYVTGWTALGTNHRKRGDFDGAEKAYNRALALQPDAWQIRSLIDELAAVKDKDQHAK